MEDAGRLQKARNNAYSLLRARPRSEFELTRRLKEKGYGDEVVETVVSELRRAGHVDDMKFARLWVESRMQCNPAGDAVLRHELKARGLSDALIEEALAEKARRYDEFDVAMNMARERFRQLVKSDKKKALKRLYDFLTRRGFGFDIVQRVIEEIV